MKGYKVDTDTYIEVSKDELENIALESTRTIDIDEFVPKSSIDPRYLIRPYYLVPDGKVGHDAFAVIRETIRNMDMVAIGRVVLTSREHIIGLEPLENGLMGTLLRYPYEVRDLDNRPTSCSRKVRRFAAEFGLIARAGGAYAALVKTRGGRPCRCPAMQNGRCRIHGGASPGAPRGAANGRFKDGYWTCEAVEERQFIRSLLKAGLNSGMKS
jgi:hypothetical protein